MISCRSGRTDKRARKTTSQTTAKQRTEKGGFTLIELLLVIALIGILVAVVFPRLHGSVRAAALRESAEELAGLVRLARVEALRRHVPVRLEIREDRRGYTFLTQDGSALHTERLAGLGDSFLDAPRALPEKVNFTRITEGGRSVPEWVIPFTSEGMSRPIVIEMADQAGRHAFIDLGAWFDQVNVRFSDNVGPTSWWDGEVRTEVRTCEEAGYVGAT